MQAQRKDSEIITKLSTFIFYTFGFCLFFLPNIIIYRFFILILKTFSMLHSTPIPFYIYLPCYIFSFIPTYFIPDNWPEGYRNFLKLYSPIFNTVRITIITFILPSIFLYTFSFASAFVESGFVFLSSSSCLSSSAISASISSSLLSGIFSLSAVFLAF